MIIIRRLFLPLIFIALLGGCAKHVSTLTPAQNIQLTGDQTLNIIAHSAKGAETLARSLFDTKVLTEAQTRVVLVYSKEAADVTRDVQGANASGATPQQRSAAILAAVGKISQLPPDLQAFLNSPQTSAEVQSLVGLIQNILSAAKAIIASNGGTQ